MFNIKLFFYAQISLQSIFFKLFIPASCILNLQVIFNVRRRKYIAICILYMYCILLYIRKSTLELRPICLIGFCLTTNTLQKDSQKNTDLGLS